MKILDIVLRSVGIDFFFLLLRKVLGKERKIDLMVSLLGSFFFIFIVLVGIGQLIENCFGYFWQGMTSKLLSGILFLSFLAGVLSFFYPMNQNIEIICICAGFSSFFYFKTYQLCLSFFKENKIEIVLLLLMTCFFSSFYPFILDHFGYYVPTIKWISEYGAVRGISNLDLIVGQMSLWHAFQAVFSHLLDTSLRVNAFILIFYGFYILEKKQWIHLVFFPFFFFFVQSPSPDLPVLVFSSILLMELLSGNTKSEHFLVLSVFIFSIKPTMIWVPIFAFLYHFWILKKYFKGILLSFFFLILFFFKNIWCFGFPVFPVQIGDIGVFWKPYQGILKDSSEIAILKTYDLQYTYDEIKHFSRLDYVINWLTLSGMKGVINMAFVLVLLVLMVFAIVKKKNIYSILIISVLFKSILVVIFSAQYRFFLDVFVVFVLIFLLEKKQNKIFYQSFFVGLTSLFGVLFSFPNIIQTIVPSFRLGEYMQGFNVSQLLSPSQYHYHRYCSIEIGNLKMNVTKNNPFNFETPLPSVSSSFLVQYEVLNIIPQKIGKKLNSGFVWRKMTKEERQKLHCFIIENHLN